MSRRYVFTIGFRDVGKSWIRDILGHRWQLSSSIGRVQPRDIGKRAYHVDGRCLQIENDEQRDLRGGVDGP